MEDKGSKAQPWQLKQLFKVLERLDGDCFFLAAQFIGETEAVSAIRFIQLARVKLLIMDGRLSQERG